jgi:hypothetical protein
VSAGSGVRTTAWSTMRAEAHSRVDPIVSASHDFYALAVVGLPGTGKTTVLEVLTDLRPDLSYVGTSAFHAPGSRMAHYIHRLFVEADPRAAVPCQFEALTERTLLQRSADSTACVDEPIEAVLAHTQALWACGLLTDSEAGTWLTAYELASRTLPSAASMVLLTCDREERRRRTRLRGRLRDGSVGEGYLDAFDEALREMLQSSRAHGVPTFELDTTGRSPRASAERLRLLL